MGMIYAEDVIKNIDEWLDTVGTAYVRKGVSYYGELLGCIEDAATVEPPKGEWEECDWVEYDGHGECIRYSKEALRCSNCCNAFKKELLWKDNFCPNCGARMKEE